MQALAKLPIEVVDKPAIGLDGHRSPAGTRARLEAGGKLIRSPESSRPTRSGTGISRVGGLRLDWPRWRSTDKLRCS